MGFENNKPPTSEFNFLNKIALSVKPFIGQISGFQTNENFKRKELVLTGEYDGHAGDHTVMVNGDDQRLLVELFGEDWSKLDKEAIFEVGAKDTGRKFKEYVIYNLTITKK